MNECTVSRNIEINRTQSFKTLNFCYLKSLHVHVRGSRAEWRAVRERRIARALPQTRVVHVCAGTCAEYQIRTHEQNTKLEPTWGTFIRALPKTRVVHVCAGTCAEYQIRTYMGNLHSRTATNTCCPPCLRRYLRRIPN
jgi:hypothetical protein